MRPEAFTWPTDRATWHGVTTLVVTDLDGTFWGDEILVDPRTRQALVELRSRPDVEFLVATGRRSASSRRALTANGMSLPAVVLNGAHGVDFVTGETFHTAAFDPSDLDRVIDVLAAHDLAPAVYLSDDRVLVIEGTTTCQAHLDQLGPDKVAATFDDLVGRTDVLGMSMLGIEASLVAEALNELSNDLAAAAVGYRDSLYKPFSFMIGPRNVSKALGIDAWIEHFGLGRPDRVIAMGDGGNDLEMLASADLGLAPVTADPRAQELADHLIGHPDDGGWAQILDFV